MLINILCLIVGIAVTLIWLKVFKAKVPLNYQEIILDKICLIFISLIIVGGVCLYIYLPLVLKWVAINIWGISSIMTESGGKVIELVDLGPLGDIYGSLNTLVASIAFIAVALATYLQVISLKESREVNREQIEESRHSIFTAKFYGLMNYKLELLKTLKVNDTKNEYKGYEIFELFFNEMGRLLRNEWSDLDKIDDKIFEKKFHAFGRHINGAKEFANWFSYFLIYAELIKLIKQTKIDNYEKQFFIQIMRNSMTMEEQVTLFWIAPFLPKVHPYLRESGIFSVFYNPMYVEYGIRFYDASYFDSSSWRNNFDNK